MDILRENMTLSLVLDAKGAVQVTIVGSVFLKDSLSLSTILGYLT
jgi:hypothetical protein